LAGRRAGVAELTVTGPVVTLFGNVGRRVDLTVAACLVRLAVMGAAVTVKRVAIVADFTRIEMAVATGVCVRYADPLYSRAVCALRAVDSTVAALCYCRRGTGADHDGARPQEQDV